MSEKVVQHIVNYTIEEVEKMGKSLKDFIVEGEIAKHKVDYSIEELSERIIPTSILKNEKQENSISANLNETPLSGEVFRKYPANPQIEVSNLGRAKMNGKIAEQLNEAPDYLYVLNKKYKLYRLVAETWCERPEGETKGLQVHHISNNGFDNRVDNLLWLTPELHRQINHKTRL
jgi:hypothetical protein